MAIPAPPGPAAMPQPTPNHTIRIALLLPLKSSTLAKAAEAVRDGFMAAWDHDRDGFLIDVIATGDTPQEGLDAYARAAAEADIIVGPLTRSSIDLLAGSAVLIRPTIALSHSQGVALPRQMLAVGLSNESEADQVAQWAALEHPNGRALVLAGPAVWQQRIAKAFEASWADLGRYSQRVDLPIENNTVDKDALDQLGVRVGVDRPELLFAALDPNELRQVRSALVLVIPSYGTSSINPGEPGTKVPELDGIRLVDLPWVVLHDNPGVMAYPRRHASGQALDLDRMYALGIDAFRIARQVVQHPNAPFTLDGVTGLLTISFDGTTQGFARKEAPVIYQDGAFHPAQGTR
ncbi:penicillin-binding protein activator [Massilia horti]|uniref:penicillin-binding protein activator n=1 Tax=Massilia horti TaxID=2562153 RepID=UPI001E360F35|nr:penicillin-binding protein activator [Massilia horti]